MTGYAVVDVETTGLSPAQHHRVVEIGVVHLDEDGVTTSEWSTLLNPQRDLGATHIHQIRAADVRRAPTFDRVAGELARLLADRTVVAHNLAFDARFLAAEFARMNVDVPLGPGMGLCTMRMAATYLPRAGTRSLQGCCAAVGVTCGTAHSALADAHAAAGLLGHYLAVAPTPRPWADVLHRSTALRWPRLPVSQTARVTRSAAGQDEPHFLSRIVDRMPLDTEHDELQPYLAVLDRALIDRHLSMTEADELVDTAQYLGLSRDTVVTGHRRYLTALAGVAWDDGVLTDEEMADLRQVTALLGLGDAELAEALREGEARRTNGTRGSGSGDVQPTGSLALVPGDHVVFTGTSDRSREEWQGLADAAGLVPRPGVTKKTRVVVAADPDSLSSKARKARDYGIPIITEDAFAKVLATLR